jgi:hypothetical protein
MKNENWGREKEKEQENGVSLGQSFIESCCNWLWLRENVQECYTTSSHPMQNLLLLVTEPLTREHINKEKYSGIVHICVIPRTCDHTSCRFPHYKYDWVFVLWQLRTSWTRLLLLSLTQLSSSAKIHWAFLWKHARLFTKLYYEINIIAECVKSRSISSFSLSIIFHDIASHTME